MTGDQTATLTEGGGVAAVGVAVEGEEEGVEEGGEGEGLESGMTMGGMREWGGMDMTANAGAAIRGGVEGIMMMGAGGRGTIDNTVVGEEEGGATSIEEEEEEEWAEIAETGKMAIWTMTEPRVGGGAGRPIRAQTHTLGHR